MEDSAMQIELPEQVADAFRDALTPVIERLVDERVEQRRAMLLSVAQVASELSSACSTVRVDGQAGLDRGRCTNIVT
jgi:hypothetical protein